MWHVWDVFFFFFFGPFGGPLTFVASFRHTFSIFFLLPFSLRIVSFAVLIPALGQAIDMHLEGGERGEILYVKLFSCSTCLGLFRMRWSYDFRRRGITCIFRKTKKASVQMLDIIVWLANISALIPGAT